MVLERRQSIISRLSHIFRSPRRPFAESSGSRTLSASEITLPSPTLIGDRFSDVDLIISLYDKPLPSIPGGPAADTTESAAPLWTPADSTLELQGNVEYHNGRLVGATKNVLIRKMTPVDPSPIDPFLCRVFFLTFRLFFTPRELAEALIRRYCVSPPRGLERMDLVYWQKEIGGPIRRRVFHFVKIWLEMYWVSGVDDEAISPLKALIKKRTTYLSPWAAYVVGDLLHKRTPSGATSVTVDFDNSKSSSGGLFVNQVEEAPPKVRMGYALGGYLEDGKFKKINITHFDPLELARQLTILESKLFCAVRPEDVLLGNCTGASGDGPVLAKSLRDIEISGVRIKRWVSESILQPYRFTTRATMISFFIRVASHCVKLNNFTTPRSIVQALDDPEVSRLYWAFRSLPKRYKLELEYLRKLVGESNNHAEYRMKLQSVPSGPAVPQLDVYLFDITFCLDCYPHYRASPFKTDPARQMINLTKYYRLVEIYEDMTRFQVPFNLEPVSGFENYMNAQHKKIEGRKSLSRGLSSRSQRIRRA